MNSPERDSAGAADRGTPPPRESWIGTIKFVALVFAGFFAFQTAAAQRFYIPSDSMMPTLLKGDQLIVSKYPYGWSYASPPLHGSAVIGGRLFGKLPERGDIVTVARREDGLVLIKRVIGLPGDTIEVRHGVVILNGVPVKRVPTGTADIPVDRNLPCDARVQSDFRKVGQNGDFYCRIPRYRETLPNGVSYDTLDLGDGDLPGGFISPGDDYGPVAVPAGHVFLMGDNRDQSADSRFALDRQGLGGPVPIASIAGRAELITHSHDGSASWVNPVSWFTSLRGDRAGTSLRPEHDAE
jgi:signal peptidase I